MYFYLIQTNIDDVINDLESSARQGIEWGNTVAIALTASLLAISLIKFLYDRS